MRGYGLAVTTPCCCALVWSALTIVGVALFILSAPLLALCAPHPSQDRLGATRGVVVLLLFVLMEWLGLPAAGGSGVATVVRSRRDGSTSALSGGEFRLAAGGPTLWRWSRRILRVRVEVVECLRSDRPLLMLVRHASHADTLLPVHLLRPLGRDLRLCSRAAARSLLGSGRSPPAERLVSREKDSARRSPR